MGQYWPVLMVLFVRLHGLNVCKCNCNYYVPLFLAV